MSPSFRQYLAIILIFPAFGLSRFWNNLRRPGTSLSSSDSDYPYDPRIHNFGNIGFGGKFHAMMARPITKVIDNAAYDGVNVRQKIVNNMTDSPSIISDWCCGVGMSTDALAYRYPNATFTGVDTSPEMLEVAKKLSPSKAIFLMDNAESVVLPEPADLITIMFGFHEIPQEGRRKILENARKNLADAGHLLVVDIDMTYTPSPLMLSGEPYIMDYLANVQQDIVDEFPDNIEKVIVPGHVRLWYCAK